MEKFIFLSGTFILCIFSSTFVIILKKKKNMGILARKKLQIYITNMIN